MVLQLDIDPLHLAVSDKLWFFDWGEGLAYGDEYPASTSGAVVPVHVAAVWEHLC